MKISLRYIFVFCLLCFFVSGLRAATSLVNSAECADVIRVACVGDSITYGSKIDDREANCYPAQLGKLLGSKFEVINFGHGGARVSTIAPKCYMNFPEYRESLKFNPDVVIIALGINDCSVKEWENNKKVFTESYEKLISSYQNLDSKPKIWLTTLMPVMPPYEPYLAIQENMKQCAPLIESLAAQHGLTVIDLFTPLNRQQRIYAIDGIHPSAEGAAIIARKICSAITGDFGGLSLPYVFGDHMVIQRDEPVRVFGKGNVGDTVYVKLSALNGQATVDGNGEWQVELGALKAGGPYKLSVSADKKIEYSDVMAGEVWLCAGQSNMAFTLKSDRDAEIQLPLADNYPRIRLLKRSVNPGPSKKAFTADDLAKITTDNYYSGDWQICSSETAKEFSAVGCYFALELYKTLGVPVGIIQNAVGGAPIEAFMPREAFQKERLYPLTVDWLDANSPSWHRERAKMNLANCDPNNKGALPHHPYEPTFIYYADIEEMMPYVIRGVLWYQGETNACDVETNRAWDPQANKDLFKGLINSWRANWNLGDLPFYYVQLPNMNRDWMLFRRMQYEVLNELPALGMAVTIDIGDANNVHPKLKYEVGRRLSLWARANVYEQTALIYSGPLFKEAKQTDGKIYLRFDSIGSGLATSDGNDLRGFEIQGSQGQWHIADSYIDKNCVVINNAAQSDVTAVRYAWRPNPDANLINKEKLPASPFCSEIINMKK